MTATLPVTARVEYAFTRRQGAASNGGYHAVLDTALITPRFKRNEGDALCKPRARFWGLESTPGCVRVTCLRCIDLAARLDVAVPVAAGGAK